MTPQSVQHEVARAIHHEKFIAKRPWLAKATGVRYAMISISYVVVDGDGDAVPLLTWAIGATVKEAVKTWRQLNPSVRLDDFAYTVITEPKQQVRHSPQGERVEPPDPFLAAS